MSDKDKRMELWNYCVSRAMALLLDNYEGIVIEPFEESNEKFVIYNQDDHILLERIDQKSKDCREELKRANTGEIVFMRNGYIN